MTVRSWQYSLGTLFFEVGASSIKKSGNMRKNGALKINFKSQTAVETNRPL